MERGAPKTIDDTTRTQIRAIAGCDPRGRGRPCSTWSPAKLCDYPIEVGIVAAISRETLRRILRESGVTWQSTKTWKAGTDPEFLPKVRRVLDLYDPRPSDGRVICVDEFGPLDLATGRMTYRIRTRKRWAQFLDFLKVLRARRPGERLYLVMDNYGRTSGQRSGPGARPTLSSWCSRRPTPRG